MRRPVLVVVLWCGLCCAGVLVAQKATPKPAPVAVKDPVYVCPMDPEIRSSKEGVCSKCGMKLVAGVPEPVEFHMDLTVTPRVAKPGQTVNLTYAIHDPWKDRPVTNFQVVHEKLFHTFVVSQDLEFFVHDHPTWGADKAFHYDIAFPKPGMYRVLGDFYPDGATPQLLAKTIVIPGAAPKPLPPPRDYSAKDAQNIKVEFSTIPAQPTAAQKTELLFRISPDDGIERYLGAWGHMLVASNDLIDMMHEHPFIADGGPNVQFNIVFPRAKTYRIWVQFQRNGVVNTVHFDIPVQELK